MVQTLEPPNQTLFFDSAGVLHCHTGPVFGRVMEERFEEGPPVTHSFRGLTSLTTYEWEGSILTSNVRTVGKPSLSTNRRWVAPFVGSNDHEMVVVNEYTRHSAEAPVRYTRTYRRVADQPNSTPGAVEYSRKP